MSFRLFHLYCSPSLLCGWDHKVKQSFQLGFPCGPSDRNHHIMQGSKGFPRLMPAQIQRRSHQQVLPSHLTFISASGGSYYATKCMDQSHRLQPAFMKTHFPIHSNEVLKANYLSVWLAKLCLPVANFVAWPR